MSILNFDEERRIIPRWRDSRVTALTEEVVSISPLQMSVLRSSWSSTSIDLFFEEKINKWVEQRSLPFATELLGAALVLNRLDEVVDAAQFVTANDLSSPQAKRAAELALEGLENRDKAKQIASIYVGDVNEPAKQIALLKKTLKEMPRNALPWIDLSRQYSILGLEQKALKAMRIGLALLPEHRFSIRAAVRLLTHLGNVDEAMNVIKRSELVKRDPWLMATEIAVARIADKNPKSIKQGKSLLKSASFSPVHTAELAAAIGSVELENGTEKKAKKLFLQSLRQPNDNTVAQAEWASRSISGKFIEAEHLALYNAYEARAWEFYLQGMWHEALGQCLLWLEDEPFSSRPASLGSFIALTVLEDYEIASLFVERGLRANPDDQTLTNNKVFVLTNTNKLYEAEQLAKSVSISSLTEENRAVWLATLGLIEYRKGNILAGRGLYKESLSVAENLPGQDRYIEASAIAFYIKEELRIGNTNVLYEYQKLDRLQRNINQPVLKVLLEKVARSYEALL